MGLPDWAADGLLPEGIHHASLHEIYERMVEGAPNRHHREALFGALAAYRALLKRLIPHGRLWVNGSFCTESESEFDRPKGSVEIDVAVLPDDWEAVERLPEPSQLQLMSLITLQDVIVGGEDPLYMESVQPIGGALDAFLVAPGDEPVWFDAWTRVEDSPQGPGHVKGFAEVRL